MSDNTLQQSSAGTSNPCDELVHRVCEAIRPPMHDCEKCPAQIDTPYGKAKQGCRLQAEEVIALVRAAPETSDVARDAARYRFIRQSESVLPSEHEKEFAEMWADIYQKNTSEFMDRRIDQAMHALNVDATTSSETGPVAETRPAIFDRYPPNTIFQMKQDGRVLALTLAGEIAEVIPPSAKAGEPLKPQCRHTVNQGTTLVRQDDRVTCSVCNELWLDFSTAVNGPEQHNVTGAK